MDKWMDVIIDRPIDRHMGDIEEQTDSGMHTRINE